MVTSAPPPTAVSVALPPVPLTAEDTGLPVDFLSDLIVKVLYYRGAALGHDIADQICLPFNIVEGILRHLADEGFCSSTGVRANSLAHESLAAGMEFVISSKGRQRARELIPLSQYAGPAPIPIDVYTAACRLQAAQEVRIDHETMANAFSSLVTPTEVIDHLGHALTARRAMFLHGPPGNGKSTLAELCAPLLGPPVFLPRALYVHGEVVRFFDPVHHEALEDNVPPHDQRWQLANRPVVKVGGELLPTMLELGFDPVLGYYEAPLQLKANGGLFVVDDFGRQHSLSPAALLNRLIVPLEKGVDYLTMARAGTTVAVPFTNVLMLSTNMKPKELMDEAFFRRVRYKVRVPNPTDDEFREIWRGVCERGGIEYNAEAIEYLIATHYQGVGRSMHGAHPRDLLSHIVNAARYAGHEAVLSRKTFDEACATYFVVEED